MDKIRELSTRDRTRIALGAGPTEGDGMDKRTCPLSEIPLFGGRKCGPMPAGKLVRLCLIGSLVGGLSDSGIAPTTFP